MNNFSLLKYRDTETCRKMQTNATTSKTRPPVPYAVRQGKRRQQERNK